MSEYDLLAAWFRVADWTFYDLFKGGDEAVVLKPLGQHSRAATFIVRAASKSSAYEHRKIAACLAGWIHQPPLDLLVDLFRQEAERDRQLPKMDFGRFETQSVVEDIVFSAAFWARRERTRSAAFGLLRTVVERTITGQYWNTASYAITTLCRHQATDHLELLNRFQQFAKCAKVDHPSNPDLTQEKTYAANLLANDSSTLDNIESLLNQKEEAAVAVNLDEQGRAAIERLVQVAERFDAS
jgi:hypothetical protein